MAILCFQLVPGPGTVTILNAAAKSGRRIGMCSVLGTIAGDFLYMLAAVLGLAALLTAYPVILSSVQWLGVAYLGWLGFKFLRMKETDGPVDPVSKQTGLVQFRQAFTVSLTNPKVIMFFMAFFPLFLSSKSGPLALLILMTHVSIISFLYQTGLVFMGNWMAKRLIRWPMIRLIAPRLAGIAFIAFGVKLALNKR